MPPAAPHPLVLRVRDELEAGGRRQGQQGLASHLRQCVKQTGGVSEQRRQGTFRPPAGACGCRLRTRLQLLGAALLHDYLGLRGFQVLPGLLVLQSDRGLGHWAAKGA